MPKRRVLLLDVGGELCGARAQARALSFLTSHVPSVYQNIAIDYKRISAGKNGADISPRDWIRIGKLVHSRYDCFNGFVIWHPTDTLAYTASALSFMFENLAKPIVVSGAILPLTEKRNDTVQNLANSLIIASGGRNGLPRISEVIVCFGSKILRATRTRRMNASSYVAFDSPNFPPLGDIGTRIWIRRDLLRPAPRKTKSFGINARLSRKILHVAVFPGINAKVMRQAILLPNVKGVVLGSYGKGNLPTTRDFLNVLAEARKRGKVVMSVTQTFGGGVDSAKYSAETLLENNGVISGSDLTPEAAFAKLSVTLGRGLSASHVRELLQYDLRGEQSDTKGQVEHLWLRSLQSLKPAIGLVNEINREALSFLRQDPRRIYDLSPRAFEKLIAEIFKHHGYDVMLTPGTRDGGFDFRALMIDGLGLSFLSYVETKRYAPNNPVGVGIVRSLYGVVSSSEASRGIIVTSSRFTKDAQEFQSRLMNRVSLHDYSDIKRWLSKIG
jgi:L-asparaginase type I